MIRVFDNVILFNPCTGKWLPAAFSVENGRIRSVRATHSLTGDIITDMDCALVTPGLINMHVHIESTLLTLHEFGRIVLPHGVTTVVADLHEIGNVGRNRLALISMIADAQHTRLMTSYAHSPPVCPQQQMTSAGRL